MSNAASLTHTCSPVARQFISYIPPHVWHNHKYALVTIPEASQLLAHIVLCKKAVIIAQGIVFQFHKFQDIRLFTGFFI